ncbi:MAG: Fic family protein [Rickettsiales bacterium]|jgi:Fic family protein
MQNQNTSSKKDRIGKYVKSSIVSGETFNSYIPSNLPPEPPIDLSEIYPLLDKANTALGRLDGISLVLPDPSLFLYMYVRKEAVLSSQIEGTQSSLSDLLLFENNGQSSHNLFDDVTEVSSYVAAMNYSIERLEKLPLSLRLIREAHEKLMNNSRGNNKNPGEFRTSQNWIGGSRPGNALFVPPPAEKLMDCLDNFEKFLHDEKVKMPILIRAAIAHVQFETIHPFLDGNGRIGRLLITLMLCNDGILKQPSLYLSLYFKANRQEYYNHLQNIRETGDFESWIKFFLTGVEKTSNGAVTTAKNIINLFNQDSNLIETSDKCTPAILAIYKYLQKSPITNTGKIKEECKISLPTIIRNMENLEYLGIVEEVTKKERHKIFVYKKYLEILNDGEPINNFKY